jgi:4'-phosphopantetheinyl transferase
MSLRIVSQPGSRSPAGPALLEWSSEVDVPDLVPDQARVWIVDLDAGLAADEDPETAEPGAELEWLSADERARAARFVRARDRRRFARCRAALRAILGRLLAEPPGSLRFRAAARGKPELDLPHPPGGGAPRDGRPVLRFNVSHSSDLGLIAVCRGLELGIDLERVRPIPEAVRIVESFFTAAEQAEFAAIAGPDRDLAFHRGWTRKEAVLKGFGMGLAGLSAHHETGFGTAGLTPGFTPATPAPRVDRWRLWEAAPRPGFVAALAVEDGDPAGPDPDTHRAGADRTRSEATASLPATARTP